jgi:hypothetical protein
MSRRRPDRRNSTVLRFVVAFVAAAALSGGLVSAPSAFAGSRARVAAAPTVLSATRKTALPLPAPGSLTVQSIALTKGTWTVIAKASAFGTANGDFFRCELFDRTTALDGVTTFLTPVVPEDVLTNIAVIKVKTAVTVRQECGHDGAAGNGGSIDAGARIVAFVTPASRVRIARTTAPVNLGSDPVGVENLSLTAGTWVVAVKLTPVELSDPDAYADCGFDGNGVTREIGTDQGNHAASTMFIVRSTANLLSTTTFTLTCSATGDGVYLDAGAVFWAWKANALVAGGPGDCPIVNSASPVDAYVMEPTNCEIGSGSFPTELAGAHLPAGTWVGLGSLDQLLSGGENVARCEILDATHGKQLDETSTSEAGLPDPYVGDTNLAVVTVKKTLDVEDRCGQDYAAPAADARTSGWAFIEP